jgi:hypothetical protein
MRIGIVVGLPSDVERFEPVLRRLPGAEFVRTRAEWPSPHFDARGATDRALLRRGRSALDEASADFDLLMARDSYSPTHLQDWLTERGRLVAWRDPGFRSRLAPEERPDVESDVVAGPLGVLTARAEVAFTALSSSCWRHRNARRVVEVLTGDPIADAFFDVGAAARARASLGCHDDARPLVLVLAEQADGACTRWSGEIAGLRSEYEVVLLPSDRLLLHASWRFPRAWGGPGMHLRRDESEPALADLFAAAAVVIAEPGARGRLAAELGVPTLIAVENPALYRNRVGEVPSPLWESVEQLHQCESATSLAGMLTDLRGGGANADLSEGRELHRGAARCLADRLCAAAQLLVSGSF